MKNKSLLAFLALALILLAGCSAAGPPTSSEIPTVNPVSVVGWWGNWEWLAVMALFVSMLIIALVYMGATALGYPQIIAWCKVEIYQIAMTALMLGGLIIFINFLAGLDTSVVGLTCVPPTGAGPPGARIETTGVASGCNMFDLALSYLKWLRGRMWVAYERFILIYQKYGMIAQSTYGFVRGGIGSQFQAMSGLSPVLGYTQFLSNFIIPELLVIMIQIEVLKYIYFGALNIILPIGVVLRSFSPTRDFGGALMGMAITLFVFYPFLLVVNYAAVLPSGMEFREGITVGGVHLCGEDESSLAHTAECGQFTDAGGTTHSGGVVVENQIESEQRQKLGAHAVTFQQEVTAGPCTGTIFGFGTNSWLCWLLNQAARWHDVDVLWSLVGFRTSFNFLDAVIAGLVLPIINFIILVAAGREISRFLGEEIDLSNITRMV